MATVEALFTKTIDEIEKMLNSKTVVGAPIEVQGHTVIPLVSVGFGFGAGEASGTDPKSGSGGGAGTGGGGGVKPIAIVVIGPEGVRLDSVKGGGASVLEKAIDTVGEVMKGRASPEAAPASE